MKIEFTSAEVEARVRESVQREFPDHSIERYNQTSYGHLIIDLKRRSLLGDACESLAPGGNLNDE